MYRSFIDDLVDVVELREEAQALYTPEPEDFDDDSFEEATPDEDGA